MVVGALLHIVDPLSSAPAYLQVTADVEAQLRSALARLVAIDSFLLLLPSSGDKTILRRWPQSRETHHASTGVPA